MDKLQNLEKRVKAIENRNKRVETDKAWETSLTRKILLAMFTYIIIATYMYFVLHIDPWINAIIPTIGFLLSTLTLPFFKSLWLKFIHKK